MNIKDSPSPNFGERRDGKTPRLLVLHYTDTLTLAETLALLQDPAREASAHYVVDEDGSILRLVDEKHRAWHAGASSWEGETDVNSASIGIEIQNPGHAHGLRAFPQKQIEAVAGLCRDIIARHGIRPHHVLAHSDIAPGRKLDPGHLFPWRALAAQNVGLWPAVLPEDRAAGDVKDLLVRYGYDKTRDLHTLTAAFQRHFQPESFAAHGDIPLSDAETTARLRALVRMKESTP